MFEDSYLLKEAIEENNEEKFKTFISFDKLTPLEQDLELLNFKVMVLKIKDPHAYLDLKLRGMFEIAQKHNLDFVGSMSAAIDRYLKRKL